MAMGTNVSVIVFIILSMAQLDIKTYLLFSNMRFLLFDFVFAG